MIIFRKFSQAGLKAECADVRAPHPQDVLHLESVTKCPSVTGIAPVFCCPETIATPAKFQRTRKEVFKPGGHHRRQGSPAATYP